MNKQVFKNRAGQVIGVLHENTFTKRVNERKHLLRIWDAWGVQDTVLNQLPSKTKIHIIDDDEKVYETTVEEYYRLGQAKEFGAHGMQMFLSRKHFNKEPTTLPLL